MEIHVTRTLPNGTVVNLTAANPKEAFHGLAAFTEVLGETTCGHCGSQEIIPAHRMTKDANHYYSWKCLKCNAQMDMGQNRDRPSLFPKRTKEDGTFDVENKGWYFYWERRKEETSNSGASSFSSPAPQQAQPQQAQPQQAQAAPLPSPPSPQPREEEIPF